MKKNEKARRRQTEPESPEVAGVGKGTASGSLEVAKDQIFGSKFASVEFTGVGIVGVRISPEVGRQRLAKAWRQVHQRCPNIKVHQSRYR